MIPRSGIGAGTEVDTRFGDSQIRPRSSPLPSLIVHWGKPTAKVSSIISNGASVWPRIRNTAVQHIIENTPATMALRVGNSYGVMAACSKGVSSRSALNVIRVPHPKVPLY